MRRGILSYLLLTFPLFGALYFLGAAHGNWPIALAVHLFTIALCALALVAYRRTYIAVVAGEIRERSMLGRVKVTPLAQIAHGILALTYRSSSTETTRQFMLIDEQHRRLVRMRGHFWTESAMRAVAAASGVIIEEDPNPMTTQAFFEKYPGTAYWFENNRLLGAAIIFVVLVAVLGLVLGLMLLMGIPIGGGG